MVDRREGIQFALMPHAVLGRRATMVRSAVSTAVWSRSVCGAMMSPMSAGAANYIRPLCRLRVAIEVSQPHPPFLKAERMFCPGVLVAIGEGREDA